MSILRTPTHLLKQFSKKANLFAKDSKAVAAVEFALIAPLLVVLFIGTVEVSLAVAIDRKLSRTSSAVADLITQQQNISIPELNVILGATDRIMFPYEQRIPCVVISKLEVNAEDTNGNGVIDDTDEVIARVTQSIHNNVDSPEFRRPDPNQCSRSSASLIGDQNARQRRVINSIFPLPDSIRIDNSTIIVAEVEYDHSPIVGFINDDSVSTLKLDATVVTLGDRIFLRPRRGDVGLPIQP